MTKIQNNRPLPFLKYDRKSPPLQIGIGVGISVLAALFQWITWAWIAPNRFTFFHPAVLYASLVVGLYCGISTTLTSAALSIYLFYPPPFSFTGETPAEWSAIFIFVIVGITLSLTSHKLKRRTFELNEEKLLRLVDQSRSRLIENLKEGYALCKMLYDEKGQPEDFIYIDINPAFEKLTGLRNVTGMPVSRLIPGLRKLNPEIFEAYGRVALGGPPQSLESYIPVLDQWFSIHVYRPEAPMHFVALFENITERIQASQALKESEKRLRTLLENLSIGVIVYNPDKTIQFLNQSAGNLLGISAPGLPQKSAQTPSWLFLTEDEMPMPADQFAVNQVCDTLQPLKDQLIGIRPIAQGAPHWVLCNAYPEFNESGQLLRVIATFTDITELIRAEEKIQKFETSLKASEDAMKSKTRFMDIAAHELRTPVTALSLLLQLTQKKFDKGYPVDVFTLMRLRALSERLYRLVVELLDISRIERGVMTLKLERTDLLKLVSESIETFRLQAPHRKFTFTYPRGQLEFDFDPLRIHQVFSNLVDNALKYTPDGTPIQVEITSTLENVRVSVQDQGEGIPENLKSTLFRPFTRGPESPSNPPGLGIGLYICREILELHKGKIGLISDGKGHGSTFYFELPTQASIKKAA